MNISDKYKSKAIALGLCDQWKGEWKDNSSREELVEKFVNGNDFCIMHNFPSVQDMKNDFGDILNNFGVYADQNIQVKNKDFIMLCGKCEADIVVEDVFCDIYIRHDSEAKISVSGSGRAFVRMYDNSYVDITSKMGGRAYVYDYCGATIRIDGNAVVRDRKNVPKNLDKLS